MKTVVILIHGIRTRAEWQEKIPEWLGLAEDVVVKPIGYGRLDVAKFLSPVLTRQRPIDILMTEIDDLAAKYPAPEWRRVVIAHSFGTYAIAKILEARPSLVLDDLLLCGSIIPENYDWVRISKQIRNVILNDCGRRDIWPVMAKSVTWGYGATGTYGIQSGAVTNRFHSIAHSDFFSKEFVRTYWTPFIESSDVVPSHLGSGIVRSPWYFELLRPKLRLVVPLLLVAMLLPPQQKLRVKAAIQSTYVQAYEALYGPYISKAADEAFVQADDQYFKKADPIAAAPLYLKATELGHPVAQGSLAKLVFMGWGGYEADTKAGAKMAESVISELEVLAVSSPEAAYTLGFLKSEGIGTDPDPEQAEAYFLQAAEGGHGGALRNLAVAAEENSDFDLAFELLQKSATQNVARAYLTLGRYYQFGLGTDVNHELAVNELLKARDVGLLDASERLGNLYYDDDSVMYDLDLAKFYLKEAADGGRASSQTQLAYVLLEESVDNDDFEQAIGLLEEALAQDFPRAFGLLGDVFWGRYDIASHRSDTKAIELFQTGARLGDQKSHYRLSFVYFNGIGAPANFTKALFHSEACMDRYLDCMNRTALIYQEGSGVTKDVPKAIELHRRNADRGSYYSAINLARLLEKASIQAEEDGLETVAITYGREVIKRALQAIDLNGEESDPYFRLGQVYAWGIPGVPVNHEAATKNFILAAERGHAAASNNAGFRLLIAQGTDYLGLSESERREKAKEYLLKAARGGNTNALANLEGLATGSSKILDAMYPDDLYVQPSEIEYLIELFGGISLNSLRWENLSNLEANLKQNACRTYTLGLRYYERNFLPSEVTESEASQKAQELFEAAVLLGSRDAMYSLGRMHVLNEAFPPNQAYGLELLNGAIDLGYGKAATFLAQTYFMGEWITRDTDLGRQFLFAAVDLGEDHDLNIFQREDTMIEELSLLDTSPSSCSG